MLSQNGGEKKVYGEKYEVGTQAVGTDCWQKNKYKA